jgi:ribosomal protein S18 acetylase RimI-like enzyme
LDVSAAPDLPSWSLTSWPHDNTTAALTLQSGHQPDAHVSVDLIREWATAVASTGYQRIRTNAIGPAIAGDLAERGFTIRQELVLLSRGLDSWSSSGIESDWRIGRVGMNEAVRIDLAAFGDEWSVDHASLSYAIHATQEAHLNGARRAGRFGLGTVGPMARNIGYCLTGCTDHTGYIQRLAVLPSSRRRGGARSLVVDALEWLRARDAVSVYVNTDVQNDAALHLYSSLGFQPLDYGLSVMESSRDSLLAHLDSGSLSGPRDAS